MQSVTASGVVELGVYGFARRFCMSGDAGKSPTVHLYRAEGELRPQTAVLEVRSPAAAEQLKPADVHMLAEAAETHACEQGIDYLFLIVLCTDVSLLQVFEERGYQRSAWGHLYLVL